MNDYLRVSRGQCRPHRVRDGERRRDGFLRCAKIRMSPTTWTFRMAAGVDDDVVDNVVIAGRTDPGRYIVQVQRVANLPGDDVIGAGSVTADADGAEQRAVGVVKRQPATKDIHAADFLADQRVVRLAVVFRRPLVSRARI